MVTASKATGRRYWYVGPNPALRGRRCVCLRWGGPKSRGNVLVMFRGRQLVVVHGRSCLRKRRLVDSRGRRYPLDWELVAASIKGLAGWRCEHCGHRHNPEVGRTLTVHHLDGNPENNDYRNLVALCQACHLHWQASWLPRQIVMEFARPAWMRRRGLGRT